MPNSRWGDASPYNLSNGPNNVPAGRHHSSGPKEKGLPQTFRPFFGQIDGRPKEKKRRIGGKDYKKRFSPGDENHFGDLLLPVADPENFGGGGFEAQNLKNLDVFTKIESDFSAEIGNSNVFFAQNQVVSIKKKKKKKKRSSPKLRVIFLPDSLRLGRWGGMHPELEPNYSK